LRSIASNDSYRPTSDYRWSGVVTIGSAWYFKQLNVLRQLVGADVAIVMQILFYADIDAERFA
jgi:hypothetical protein